MRWLKWLLRGALVVLVAAVLAAGWLLGTEGGLRWALGFAPPQLEVQGARGALARTVSFERVAYQGSEARNVSLELDLFALVADTISVAFLRIESLKLVKPDSAGGSAPFPFQVRVRDAQVKSLVYEGYEIHDLRADYSGTAAGHEAQATFSAEARARA
jgi:autotransporter translocation and assembly factor TamB